MDAALAVDSAALLDELIGREASQRLGFLRASGDPAELIGALGEETDRLVTTEVGQGLAASEMIVTLADELGDACVRADMRGVRAMTLAYAGRFAEALASCEAAVGIAEQARRPVAAARARLASVHALSELGRYDDAIAAGEEARAVFASAGEPILAARADVSIGAAHDRRDDPAQALAHYDRALPALAHDPLVAAQIASNRGIALMGLDEFAQAETAFAAAVTVFADGDVHWAAAIAEGNLAFLSTRQGRLDRALHHFARARHFIEADESPADLARLLGEQANALASLGMPVEALRLYERVLPDLETHGLTLEAAEARAGLGRVRLQLGQLDEAETALATSATDLKNLGQNVARARVDLIRAELAFKDRCLDRARTLAADALDMLAGRPSEKVVAMECLARIDLEDGNLHGAAARIAAALPIAERLDVAPLRAQLLHVRGLVKTASGEHEAALPDFRAAIEQVERVRGVLQAERLRSAFLGSRVRVYEDAVRAALILGGVTAVAEAFALAERAKGRALLDVVGALDLEDVSQYGDADPTERALLADLARLRGELNWHYSRLDEPDPDAASGLPREEWRATTRRLETELDALEDRLAAARGVAGLFASPLGLDEVLRFIPAGTALIEYFAVGSEVIAFVLRDGEASVVRQLAAPDDLDERVSRVQFQIGRAVASAGRPNLEVRSQRMLVDLQRELGELHEVLIAPLGDALGGAERLLVVPHGSLHTLPFAALWDGTRYLIESHEIVVVPSASVLGRLSTDRAPTAEGEALVVGVPDGFAPWIETEAERVAGLLGVKPLLGAKATAARFAADARDAPIVHLACHGRFLPDRPLASGLKLADRWLTVRDIYALRLRASLVTLSGCETGRALVTGGDELLGVLRGFFAAGAASLLISLWVVNDESATEVMTRFYAAYREGEPAAAALRAAQRALLARGVHPAYWAPFILGGAT